jgi:hypothetical protein
VARQSRNVKENRNPGPREIQGTMVDTMDHNDPRRHGISSPRVGVGVPVIIVTVSFVIGVILFIRFMMTYRAPNSGTRNAMMARHVAHNSANYCSFETSGSKGRRRRNSSQDEHSAENQNRFHDTPPYYDLVNACRGCAFHPTSGPSSSFSPSYRFLAGDSLLLFLWATIPRREPGGCQRRAMQLRR